MRVVGDAAAQARRQRSIERFAERSPPRSNDDCAAVASYVHGVTGIFGELYIVYRLGREVLRRVAGVAPGASLLATVFALGVLVDAFRHIAAPVLKALRPRPPSVAGMMFAAAVPAAALRRITGASAPDAVMVGATVGLSGVAPAFHACAASARAASAALAAVGRLAIGKPAEG